MIDYSDFEKVDIRVGKIIQATELKEAKKPAYKMQIDFRPDIGVKWSSAQITKSHNLADLQGTLVIAVINFAPKTIAGFKSEVLTLGLSDGLGGWVLVSPVTNVALGGRLK
jgi:tRNA-binding protein